MNKHKSTQLRRNLNNHIDENRMMINFIDDTDYDFSKTIRQQLVDSLKLMLESSKLDLEDPTNYGNTLYMIIDTKNKPSFLSSTDPKFSSRKFWDIYVDYKQAWQRDSKIKSIIDGTI